MRISPLVLLLAGAVVVIGVSIMVRELFPKKVLQPIRIELQVDTVETVDTLWRTKLKTDTLWQTRQVVQKPETVYRVPPLVGLTALAVAKVGDTTRAGGFRLVPLDTGYTLNLWQSAWYTPGPLTGLSIPTEGNPRVSFGPPVRDCGFGCTLKHYLTGAIVGGGTAGIACMVTR